MGMLPKQRVELSDFPGVSSREDPDDIKPGEAVEQVNAQGHHPGELRIRPGVKVLSFEEE